MCLAIDSRHNRVSERARGCSGFLALFELSLEPSQLTLGCDEFARQLPDSRVEPLARLLFAAHRGRYMSKSCDELRVKLPLLECVGPQQPKEQALESDAEARK
jgi:hypothetical protein